MEFQIPYRLNGIELASTVGSTQLTLNRLTLSDINHLQVELQWEKSKQRDPVIGRVEYNSSYANQVKVYNTLVNTRLRSRGMTVVGDQTSRGG